MESAGGKSEKSMETDLNEQNAVKIDEMSETVEEVKALENESTEERSARRKAKLDAYLAERNARNAARNAEGAKLCAGFGGDIEDIHQLVEKCEGCNVDCANNFMSKDAAGSTNLGEKTVDKATESGKTCDSTDFETKGSVMIWKAEKMTAKLGGVDYAAETSASTAAIGDVEDIFHERKAEEEANNTKDADEDVAETAPPNDEA